MPPYSNSDFTRAVLLRFAAIALPLLALLAAIAAGHYYTEQKMAGQKLEAAETANLNLAQQAIIADLQTVASDLRFLVRLNEMQEMLETTEPPAGAMLAREFLNFSENRGVYDQIRYLSADGTERVRVNFHDGHPRIVGGEGLQRKAGRYYFREALALEPGQVYISPFDLNIEHDRIELPLKPTIRFATPLFDPEKRAVGLLVLNYLGERLIRRFRQAAANIADHAHLLNARGYWLSGPQAGDDWGFMLGHERTFARRFPDAWERIKSGDGGQFYNAEGLFTYATLRPSAAFDAIASRISSTAQAETWKIVAHVAPPPLAVATTEFLRRHRLPYGTMALMLLLGSFVVARTGIRHRLVKAQREYDRRFRATLENIQLAAITFDADGRIIFCNDRLLEQTGWSRKEVLGHRCTEVFIPPADRPKAGELLAEMSARADFPATFENRVQTKSGQVRLYAWNSTLSSEAGDRVSAVTCIGEDVTERRRAEEQIRKLSRAVEQSPNPVIITDANGIIEYVNPKFTELTGYTLEEVLGQRPSLLKSGETTPHEYEDLWRTIKAGGEWRGLFHNRKKSGELYWEYTAISPIRNADGRITHYLAVKEDVTERRRLEEEIAERTRELAQAQGLAVVGRMANMVAHDLRNPLSSVKMALQILGRRTAGRERMDAEAAELKQIALEQVRYMEEILADLLQFSRPDALKPDWLSVDKLLDAALAGNERIIKKHDARVITEYQPHLPTIHADATKLRQVFNNLIENALQATEGAGRAPEIRIRTSLELEEHLPRVRVELTDNGTGIDPHQVERLFEPFYTTRARGTGLGLAIVKRIVEQHHGSVRLESAPGGGARVTVVLPTGPVQ